MRESERSDSGTEDGGERSGEDLPQSQDTITAAPEPGATSSPPGEVPKPDEAPKRRPGRRLFALIALTVAGLAALGGGVFGLVWAFSRVPDSAQVTAVANAESARQWRWLPAGKLFPATVGYASTAENVPLSAALVGIAPAVSCATGTDKATAKALTAAGCVTVLRATYTDASHTALDTVGIAVMKSSAAANNADSSLGSGTSSGLLPVSFPATVSSAFTAQGRTLMDTQVTGRYVIFDAAGYADGRKAVAASNGEGSTGGTGVSDLASALSTSVMNELSPSGNPCADREVRCSY